MYSAGTKDSVPDLDVPSRETTSAGNGRSHLSTAKKLPIIFAPAGLCIMGQIHVATDCYCSRYVRTACFPRRSFQVSHPRMTQVATAAMGARRARNAGTSNSKDSCNNDRALTPMLCLANRYEPMAYSGTASPMIRPAVPPLSPDNVVPA